MTTTPGGTGEALTRCVHRIAPDSDGTPGRRPEAQVDGRSGRLPG